MGWEMRGGCGPYYTRSRRIGGRVVREYVGGGPIGQLAAALDAEDSARRKAEADSLREERAHDERDELLMAELCETVEAVTRAALMLAGYRRHNRGEWRRKRAQAKGAGKTGRLRAIRRPR
jgi:hypothetical protein